VHERRAENFPNQSRAPAEMAVKFSAPGRNATAAADSPPEARRYNSPMSPRARAALFAVAVAVLLALPLLPETLGTRRLVFRDAQVTHWPWRRVAMEAWHEGRAPFVNTSASGGQPLLANPNAVLLYPTLLLEIVLPPAAAFNLHYLLHVLWAFLGARALASRLRLSPGPAFVAGIAYAFSGMMLSYGSAFMNSAAAAAWLPWCAAAALDLADARSARSRLRAGAAAAIGFGLQLLAGEPALSLLTLLFAAGLALARVVSDPADRPRRVGQLLFAALVSGGAALAIAAPMLALLSAVVRFSYRGQHAYSARAFGASPFAVWRLLEWLFPRFSGDPGDLGAGGHWQYALHAGDLLYIWRVTLGVVPLLLVVSAGLSADFWDRRARWLAAVAGTALLFAFGSALAPYRLLSSIEWMRRLRYPIKFYLLTTISIALLSGLATEFWSRRRAGKRQAVLLAGMGLFYAVAWTAAGPGGPLDRTVAPLLTGLKADSQSLLAAIRVSFRGDALFGLACVAVVAAALAARGGFDKGYLLGLAALLLALPWGLSLFVSGDERDLERPPALLSSMTGPGLLYVSPELSEFNVLATGTAHPALPPRVAQFARVQVEELIPATAAAFGARYLFDPDPDGSYGFLNRVAEEVLAASSPAQAERMLAAFGTRWVLEDETRRLPDARPVTGVVIAGRRLVLSRLPESAAELRWAGRAYRRTSLSDAFKLVRSEVFASDSDIVVAGRTNQDPREGPTAASLSIERIEPGRAAATLEASGAGYVIFARTYFPAWKARLDGRPAPVLVANGRDLAVAVAAGRHRVEFEYDPRPFRIGVSIQACAALLFLGLAVLVRSEGSEKETKST
jgi:hypothetical protein